ncbi:hypothetical protein OG787_46865 [Streptomyces sp. NBC_00075]|uniref:hypothetical protein n=1 Tax=Streptomyces sp. NBC_00075 TaxID=2975641 RepID=UPI0032547AAA
MHRTGRAAIEQGELYLFAVEFDKLRDDISVPQTPSELVGLATAAKQLAVLADLIKDLSDDVLFRATDNTAALDLGPVVHAYAGAAVPAGQALKNHTEALAQFGFLNRYAKAPESGDLRDARKAAFRVIQERTERVRDSLQDVVVDLRRAADRLDGTPPHMLAALSRSVLPADSPERLPACPEPPAPAPVRLAFTPVPRHAR